MSNVSQLRNFRYFEVRGDQNETLDKVKASATSVTGILLTDYGALFGVGGRVTWGAIGRFLMCGGGFLSMFWVSERLIWKGYKKAGLELGIATALVTVPLAFKLNYTPKHRLAILLGCGIVFFHNVNRYRHLYNKSVNETE